jgi:single-strand DNA-binding protein
MFSLNRVQLIGYVTQPVNLRQTPSGTSVADVNVATPYTFQTAEGNTLNGTAFHSITAWGGMADVAGQYLKPGSQVFLAGRLQTDSWEDEKTSEKRSKTKVIAMDLIMLDPKDGQVEVDKALKVITSCMNRVDVIGNLTREPELRTTTNGQHVAALGVATNERWKDKQSGEMKERTEFHNVVVWGDLAELCTQHLKKGNRVHVGGRVQTRSWETKQGSKRTTTEIVADSVALLGVKNTEITYSNEARQAPSKNTQSSKTSGGAEPVAAAVPEVKYESEVKVEDLPF